MSNLEKFYFNLTDADAAELKQALVKIMTINMNYSYAEASATAEEFMCDQLKICEIVKEITEKYKFVTDCD